MMPPVSVLRLCWCGAAIEDGALQCQCCRRGDCPHRTALKPAEPATPRSATAKGSRSPGSEQGQADSDSNAPVVARSLVLPWVCMVPDNDRIGVMEGTALLTKRYRAAKLGIETVAAASWRGGMIPGPVELRAVAWFPDARERDAGNLRKLVTDALQGIAYRKDHLIWRETWERGGIDRANPRLELTIRPYRSAAA